MAKVLLFNIQDDKGIRIKNLCRKLYFEYEDVAKEDFGFRLEYLLGLSGADDRSEGEDFDDEMLYLSEIDGGMLSIFLAQLRRIKAQVSLKAVKTETNVAFSPYELYRELSAERAAIENGMTAHKTDGDFPEFSSKDKF